MTAAHTASPEGSTMSQPVFNPFSGPFSEPAGFLPRREFPSDFSAVGENRTPTSFRPLEPESSVLRGFHEENGIDPFFSAPENTPVTDGKTGSPLLPFADLVALGAAGLTPAELAARVAAAPAVFAAGEKVARARAGAALAAARARAGARS